MSCVTLRKCFPFHVHEEDERTRASRPAAYRNCGKSRFLTFQQANRLGDPSNRRRIALRIY